MGEAVRGRAGPGGPERRRRRRRWAEGRWRRRRRRRRRGDESEAPAPTTQTGREFNLRDNMTSSRDVRRYAPIRTQQHSDGS